MTCSKSGTFDRLNAVTASCIMWNKLIDSCSITNYVST